MVKLPDAEVVRAQSGRMNDAARPLFDELIGLVNKNWRNTDATIAAYQQLHDAKDAVLNASSAGCQGDSRFRDKAGEETEDAPTDSGGEEGGEGGSSDSGEPTQS